jgi:DNA-directed RNA polymerase, mitochondrial
MKEASIEAQLDIERQMVSRGADTYKKNKETAEANNRGAETGYARRLMEEYITPLVIELERVTARKGARVLARANAHLRDIAPEKAVFIGLRQTFNHFTYQASTTSVASNIGRMIEDEIRFTRFQDKFGGYYDKIIQDFKRKGTKDYRYMHRVLTHTANTEEDGWNAWSTAERIDVGMRILDVILRCTDLVEKQVHYVKGKTDVRLVPTAAAMEFIDKYDEAASLMYPDKTPCVIPPDPWTALDQGGYYSPELRNTTKLVLTKHPKHRKILKRCDLTSVMEAVNIAQAVGWSVNTRVLEVIRQVWAKNLQIGMPSSERLEPSKSPFPDIKKADMTEQQLAEFVQWKREASEVYTQEAERKSKSFQIARILRVANDYAEYNKFWYVWTLDFRGRMYAATSGFSPQGPDVAKGMLRFAEGKPVGERGLFWHKVHGANRYGFDKVDYHERIKWVDDNHEFFMAAGNDPLGHTDVWAGADKPYQFLAWLFEYADMHSGAIVGRKPEEFISYLPIGLDGSCNGLQHFSAMLRDEKGGAATNLIPSKVPSDIYRIVADVCLDKVKERNGEYDKLWIKFANTHGQGKLPRSVAKRPVMTMPYGSTRQSCTGYICAAVTEADKNFFGKLSAFPASVALTPLLWSSIGEVVVAARQGMDWLQKCCTSMSRAGLGVSWKTSDGFVVHLYEREIEVEKIHTQLAGSFQVRVGNYTESLNKSKQRNGVAPNFVHSQDAAHLRATCRLAKAAGITSLALIHDDYGTHAADTETLHRVIRESFVAEYTDRNPLEDFRDWQEAISKSKMPPMPAMGTLDLELVLESEFFFG